MKKSEKVLVLLFSTVTITLFAQKEVDISKLPCRSEAKTPQKYLYGYGQASSANLSIAQRKASMQAMQEISDQLKSKMKVLTDVYTHGGTDQVKTEFDQLIQSSVNETLEDPTTACQKQEKEKGGKMSVYLLMQIDKGRLREKIIAKSLANAAVSESFDREKLDQAFRKEMEEN